MSSGDCCVGRRKVRSRLVNPTKASINSEDVFVLVTPTELYEYVGAKANVIEKAKVRIAVLAHYYTVR